jgi:hypothetical protein
VQRRLVCRHARAALSPLGAHHLGRRCPRHPGDPRDRDDPRLGWLRSPGPVFEGDVLRTELRVEGASPLGSGGGTARLRALVSAERGAGERSVVLDWRFVALVA